MHYLHREVPDSPVTIIAVHGAGGYSSTSWPFVAATGMSAAAIDLPLYGRTEFLDDTNPARVRYEDWVELLTRFVEEWPTPVVLYGFSIGGILAAEVAHRSSNVVGTVVTCLVECSRPSALAVITNFGILGVISPMISPLIRGQLAEVMVPMRWVARMSRMSHNLALTRQCIQDPLSGQIKVPLGFLVSLIRYRHSPSPEVVLAHPAEDTWTPLRLSTAYRHQKLIMLEGCGHFPVEEPGVEVLIDTLKETALRGTTRG